MALTMPPRIVIGIQSLSIVYQNLSSRNLLNGCLQLFKCLLTEQTKRYRGQFPQWTFFVVVFNDIRTVLNFDFALLVNWNVVNNKTNEWNIMTILIC
jgi:hypothetical protein